MPVTHYRESDMDETARLILMVADDEGGKISLTKFAIEFRKAHENSDTSTVVRFWEKYMGNAYILPTHDFRTGGPRNHGYNGLLG